MKFTERTKLNLSEVNADVLNYWNSKRQAELKEKDMKSSQAEMQLRT